MTDNLRLTQRFEHKFKNKDSQRDLSIVKRTYNYTQRFTWRFTRRFTEIYKEILAEIPAGFKYRSLADRSKGGGGHQGCMPPRDQNSFIFIKFLAKHFENNRLVHPRWELEENQENLGSATAN